MKNRAKLSITALILTMTTLTGCGLGNMVFHFPNNGNSSAYDIESPELQNKFLYFYFAILPLRRISRIAK